MPREVAKPRAVAESSRGRIEDAVPWLAARGVVFAGGLTDREVDAVQREFGFRFPPDLRAFLQVALPVGIAGQDAGRVPDWRSGDPQELRERLELPFEGIAFDIERNGFWWDAWGQRPERLEDALAVARRHVSAAAKLIPIFGHRFIPAEPLLAGNPVFSVHQTDVIFYGTDLWDYLTNEFSRWEVERWQRCAGMSEDQYYAAHRSIGFWTELVRWNAGADAGER